MSNIYWEEHNIPERSDKKETVEVPKEGIVSILNGTSCVFVAPEKEVGGYDITGGNRMPYSIKFMMTKKPNWFHRTCTRFFLGWVWVDNKN